MINNFNPQRTLKMEQRSERPWTISWLPDLQERAHDKAQLRWVPESVFSFPFSCFPSGVGKRTQPENNRLYLFCRLFCYFVEIPRLSSAKQSLSKLIIFTVVLKMSTKEAFSWEQRLVCDESAVLSE